MRPFVAFGAFMAIILALLLWQGSDAVVYVRSPVRPARSTYPGGPIVELEGSPVHYSQERQVHRRAAQPHPQIPNVMEMFAGPPETTTVTSTIATTRIVVRTTTVVSTVTITPTPSSSDTSTSTATAV